MKVSKTKVTLILLVVLVALIFAFRDPPDSQPTSAINHNTNTTTTRNPGLTNPNTTQTQPATNVSGVVILSATTIISGQSLFLGFYRTRDPGGNPIIEERADLKPTWSKGSGWVTTYWLLLPSGISFNATCVSCTPLKSIRTMFNRDGVISWSVTGPATITPAGEAYRADFECGVF